MPRPEDLDAAGLGGATIVRVDRPMTGLFALSLAHHGRRLVLLLSVTPTPRRATWGIVSDRPRGESADATVRSLREKLQGGHIVAARSHDDGVTLVVQRETCVWAFPVVAGARIAAVPWKQTQALTGSPVTAADIGEAVVRGRTLVSEHAASLEATVARDALGLIAACRARLLRRREAIEGDIRKADDAVRKAHEVAVFVPLAARTAKGVTRLVATDWSTGEAREVTLTVDPTRTAREELDALFARAKRMRAGIRVAEARSLACDVAIEALDKALQRLAGDATPGEVGAVLQELQALLPNDVRLTRPPPPERHRVQNVPAKRPARHFVSEGGTVILVGRDAHSNDALTLHVARSGDMWLHAKGCEGAHVIARGAYRHPGGLDARVLLDAATLAAHFSAEREENIVEVIYVDRRHVRKPRASAPGAVAVQNERVIALRRDDDRTKRLLASELR